MSEPSAIAPQRVSAPAMRSAAPDVRAAIARAATRTGVDFDYLLAQARIESNLDPQARAQTSSATGLYQFTNATWLETLGRHGAAHGIAMPQSRAEALAMRNDPAAAALMAAELANDNRDALTGALGREPDAAELYLAHFLGSQGAGRFLAAMSSDPGQSAPALMPKAAAANRAIFYDDGNPRSLGAVMGVIRAKVDRAMNASAGQAQPAGEWAMPADGPWHTAAQSPAWPRSPLGGQEPHTDPARRPSMAETLRQTFALTQPDAAIPAHVRDAYAKLSRFSL